MVFLIVMIVQWFMVPATKSNNYAGKQDQLECINVSSTTPENSCLFRAVARVLSLIRRYAEQTA